MVLSSPCVIFSTGRIASFSSSSSCCGAIPSVPEGCQTAPSDCNHQAPISSRQIHEEEEEEEDKKTHPKIKTQQ